MSQSAFAACDDPDALPDCMDVIGDDNDSFGGSGSGGSGSGGGGSLGMGGGGGSGEGSGVGTGNGGGSGSGQGEEEEEEPVEPPKTRREICYQEADVEHGFCRERASEKFKIDLKKECGHLGTGSGDFGPITIGTDAYSKCEKEQQAERDHKYEICATDRARNRLACP